MDPSTQIRRFGFVPRFQGDRLLYLALTAFALLAVSAYFDSLGADGKPLSRTSYERLLYVEGGLLLLVGFITYLKQVLPVIAGDRENFVTAAVCLAVFVPGFHLFCRWIYQHQQRQASAASPQPAPPWRVRWTVELAGLVLIVFAAGIAMVGLVHQSAWLASSKEPIIEVFEVRSNFRSRYPLTDDRDR